MFVKRALDFRENVLAVLFSEILFSTLTEGHPINFSLYLTDKEKYGLKFSNLTILFKFMFLHELRDA
jgi:hypothetical protein